MEKILTIEAEAPEPRTYLTGATWQENRAFWEELKKMLRGRQPAGADPERLY